MENKSIFNNKIPPFINKKLTYNEWIKIKKKSNFWNDEYFDIPDNMINKLYKTKGCSYIQISDYGLYHLGNDKCKFNVPKFNVKQEIRIRIKVHQRKNVNNFCSLSITMACKPKKLSELSKSKYSLDNINTLPNKLEFIQ